MADRDKLQQRGTVDDRRGSRSQSVKKIWWIGITWIVIVLAVWYFGWTDTALQVYDALEQSQPQVVTQQSVEWNVYAGEDDYETFVSTVLGSANTLWWQAFAANDIRYQEPRLVLFRWATQSACGGAVSQVGPHYCPTDQTIYLDETFFEDMEKRLWAQGGDVAEAYVIAHEVGHHVQNLLGTLTKVQSARSISESAWNEASIKLELQADCFAWIWSRAIDDAWVLERNEIYEAMDAAAAVWDDSIQRRTTWKVRPESWTHGSSAQRKEWFSKGFDSGDVGECNTFS